LNQESKAPSHVLWGAEQIAREIGRNRRQTFYLLESGQIPARKAGRNWFITKSALRAWLAGDTDTNKSRFAAN